MNERKSKTKASKKLKDISTNDKRARRLIRKEIKNSLLYGSKANQKFLIQRVNKEIINNKYTQELPLLFHPLLINLKRVPGCYYTEGKKVNFLCYKILPIKKRFIFI